MQAIRPAVRASARQIPITRRGTLPRKAFRRRYATGPSPEVAKGGSSGAVAGGLAGAGAAVLVGYSWYYFSGTKTVVDYARSSKQSLDSAFKSATEKAPNPNQAIQWLRETVTSYTRMIPGASQYVDQAFSDIEKLQKNHGDKVNDIINNTYKELKDVTKSGASMAAATQAWDVLQKCFKQLADLAGDAAEDLINEHPELKEKIGGGYKQLKNMAEQYGPEAKQQAEETYKQVQEVLKGGLSSANIEKARKLVEEKTQELKKYGDKAWDEGLKKAQPVLDKYPDLKETVEKNKDKLLQGDLGSLWSKVQESAKSGNVDDLKKFVQDQVSKAGESASGGMGGLENFLNGILGGSGKELSSKFSQLQELSQKHGKEAEDLIKGAFEDVKKVLEKKVEEGKSLKEKVKDNASSSSGSGSSASLSGGGTGSASSGSGGYVQGDGAAAARRFLGVDSADKNEHGNVSRNPAGKV